MLVYNRRERDAPLTVQGWWISWAKERMAPLPHLDPESAVSEGGKEYLELYSILVSHSISRYRES